jgi:PAS domain S-box-containing protein
MWYDPRELRQVTVAEGNRVFIEATFFPLWGRDGDIAHVAVVFKDVTGEHLARAEAEAERDLLRLIIEQTGDGVIVADRDGVIRIFNSEAERQHGVRRQQVSASEWARVYGLMRPDGSTLPLEETPLFRALNGEKVDNATWMVRGADFGSRTLSGTATPVLGPDGALAGAVLVTRDETERLLRDEERSALLAREQEARAEAERASRTKDEFLAVLGHELRNPLAPMVTALELMKLRSTAAPPRELEVLRRQVTHMMRLVDDLLDVSRITRGTLELHRAPIELHAVVERALEMVAPMIEQRRHRLDVDVPREGLLVLADAERLAQVVANLLTNAARYTPTAGQIAVRAERRENEVILEVRDTGIGIEPELMAMVFDMFMQGPRSSSRAEGGLGLGLALVKSLVAKHDGSVVAKSGGAGQGSSFEVRLPLLSAGVTDQAPRAQVLLAARTRTPRRVLVVDDNEDAADLLADALRTSGHEVRTALDGARALMVAASFTPDVGVLDLGLPVMDGYELAAQLRERTNGKVRLLAVSGYGQAEDRARTAAAGFARHFVKPVDLESILSAIDEQPAVAD